MLYPVLKVFRDKHTKIKYEEGQTYETEDKKRVRELKKLGYIGAPKKTGDEG